jgi:hypothetical protein
MTGNKWSNLGPNNTTREETKMRIERMNITPEVAKEILKGNTHNRFTNTRLLKTLTAAFEQGEYRFNGQPIQISRDGVLLDGQHRLLACVASGVTIDCLVIWDADPESQETMDTGRARSVADILRLRGYPNQNLTAAVARRIALAKKHGPRYGAIHSNSVVSNGLILQAVEQIQNWHRFTIYPKYLTKDFNFTASQVGFFVWLFDSIDREDSDYFWEKLKSGEGLFEGDPIYTLRQLGLNRDGKSAGTKYYQHETAAIFIKAWNKFRRGETTKRLSFRVGGANPEEFPEAV